MGQEVDALEDVKDDCGPLTEVDFWRRHMSKLTTLSECLKQNRFRSVIQVTLQGKPSLSKKWKPLHIKVKAF